MAYTISRYAKNYGNDRTVHLDITADAATQTVDTGLKIIESVSWAPASMSTYVGWKAAPNKDASGTAANGSLGISGLTSGDRLFITVYGR